ncbi:maleylacetoacetate isomerase [Pulveribacter suum]|uniref:Maleylacetoacetate isomerase n=1 Tax=Pulveribacter suum TaxID=2116657 RepID=A0A2P1NM42_9BURK|nr:maleylacetoacetate isomerase [Pulveribacter suum]AVP58125.1 maleylacetoacetate isomerase [Pulveribacter suum]
MTAKLYSYFRSSAAYRVRIALGLKGLDWQTVPVHLLQGGGQQHSAGYRATNPQALVPALQLDEGEGAAVLTQSLAIIEYLEETRGGAPLLPPDALGRARVRALAQSIACDLHPLNNLRVLAYLKHTLGVDDEAKNAWYAHWVALGLSALEQSLATSSATGRYCHGDTPGLADCCLVPQVYNARRFNCPLDGYPTIARIVAACDELPAFEAAAPERQPDAA